MAAAVGTMSLALRTSAGQVTSNPHEIPASEAGIGKTLTGISAVALDGRTVDLSGSRKARVIAYTGLDCPVCRKYSPVLARIEDAYKAKGVEFIFINPATSESPVQMKSTAKKFGFDGPYIHDAALKVTAATRAKSTGEVFVLDSKNRIVYRGAVDDQYGLNYSKSQAKTTYLKSALDSVLAGKSPKVQATTAPGCALEAPAPEPKPFVKTYHNTVEKIIQNNCVSCHRPGAAAPFSLQTYEQVRDKAAMIKYVVENKLMPPWFAQNYKHGAFRNDPTLSEADRKSLLDWIGSDKPKGDPKEGPGVRKFESEWEIGKPDAIFKMNRAIDVQAEGTMPYQDVVVPINLPEDKWVTGIEIRPSERSVVHHVLAFIVPANVGDKVSSDEIEDATRSYFARYVPGNGAVIYPQGLAKKLPKGSNLVFQIHYTPNGTATKDTCQIGMKYATTPPEHEVITVGLVNLRFAIPPGAENHSDKATVRVPTDVKILSFLPHMHVRGKAARYDIINADGTRETLLDIPKYDFNWQLQYDLAEPKLVKKGSKAEFTAWFDNSTKNPVNPDPTKTVRWGLQTYQEMLLGYIEYYVPGAKPGAPGPKIPGGAFGGGNINPFQVRLIYGQLDKNKDGFVTKEEAPAMWMILQDADTNGDEKITLEEALATFTG